MIQSYLEISAPSHKTVKSKMFLSLRNSQAANPCPAQGTESYFATSMDLPLAYNGYLLPTMGKGIMLPVMQASKPFLNPLMCCLAGLLLSVFPRSKPFLNLLKVPLTQNSLLDGQGTTATRWCHLPCQLAPICS